ncbi:MAG TPA: hypothetical protein VIV60_26515, partial [Polyangiaceae bacterium]
MVRAYAVGMNITEVRSFCAIGLTSVACMTVLLPTSASAQDNRNPDNTRTAAVPQVDPNTPAGTFGAKRQLAISSDAGLYIENVSTSGVDGSATTLQLRPAFDYFIIDNLSLGGFLGIQYQSVPTGHSTTWSIGPRIGYNIPFSDRFSI